MPDPASDQPRPDPPAQPGAAASLLAAPWAAPPPTPRPKPSRWCRRTRPAASPTCCAASSARNWPGAGPGGGGGNRTAPAAASRTRRWQRRRRRLHAHHGRQRAHRHHAGAEQGATYGPKDFEPIGYVAELPIVLSVHPSVPAGSAAEFIAYVKANSGKLSCGHHGNGSSNQFACLTLARQTGTAIADIPYRGAPQVNGDLLAGRCRSTSARCPRRCRWWKAS